MAAATMVGQYLGMSQVIKAKSAIYQASIVNLVYLLFVSALFYTTSGILMSWFTEDQNVISIGKQGIHILCIGYLAFGVAMVLQQAFNGAGDTFTPTWLSAFCYLVIKIPLAYFLAIYLDWQLDGVFWAITCSQTILALLFYILYRKDVWVKAKI